jgi:hypothetical protein
VLASGSAAIVREGRSYAVDRPEVIRIQAAGTLFSAAEERQLRLVGVKKVVFDLKPAHHAGEKALHEHAVAQAVGQGAAG